MKAEVRDIFSRDAYKDYFLTIVCDSVRSSSKVVAPGCAEVEDVFDPNPTIADPTDQCSYGTRVQRRLEQLDSWKGIQTKKA
jgi:hypothetical protein